jgi:hypothetical protein
MTTRTIADSQIEGYLGRVRTALRGLSARSRKSYCRRCPSSRVRTCCIDDWRI